MGNVSVVFAVGEDIVQRLRKIPEDKRMTFILGGIEKDYFGEHFIAIEEIGENWRQLLEYLCRRKALSETYENECLFEDSENIVILQDREQTGRILETLREPMEEREKHNPGSRGSEFQECIRTVIKVCEEAASKDASLLFCIDRH